MPITVEYGVKISDGTTGDYCGNNEQTDQNKKSG